MGSNQKIAFEFNNQVAPRYVESLLMQLDSERWYDRTELLQLLRRNSPDIRGDKVVGLNVLAWTLTGIGDSKPGWIGRNKVRLFRLSQFGRQLQDIYATNQELFFDLIHFCFYTAWPKSLDLSRARFWLYWRVSDELWQAAPSAMDSFGLTNRLQQEGYTVFPEIRPSFPERSVRAVFPWLTALSPPFLTRTEKNGPLHSTRRHYCTPQLFHLATDIVFREEKLNYGTAMTVGDRQVEAICRICMLDLPQFWPMAELTGRSIRGFELKRSQWGRSLVLIGSPSWIDLPDLRMIHAYEGDMDLEESA